MLSFGHELSEWAKERKVVVCLRHEDDGEACVTIVRVREGLTKGRSVTEWGPTPDEALALAVAKWDAGGPTVKQ